MNYYTKQIEASNLRCIHPLLENSELDFTHNDDKEFIPPKILEDFIELQKVSNFSITAIVMLARKFLERIILEKWPEVLTAKKWKYEFPTLKEMINWLDNDNDGQKRYTNADVMDSC